jgi:Diguanylate cyclase, GGDEF domain
VAGRICDNLARDGRKPKLSVSIGVAIYPKNGEKIDTLMGAADVALYSMKARARGREGNIKDTTSKLSPRPVAGPRRTRELLKESSKEAKSRT